MFMVEKEKNSLIRLLRMGEFCIGAVVCLRESLLLAFGIRLLGFYSGDGFFLSW